MSDQAAPEPTMEEILASIRRIISEDDGPAEAEAEASTVPEAAPAPEPEPVQAFEPAPEPVEDVLELTERVDAAARDGRRHRGLHRGQAGTRARAAAACAEAGRRRRA